MGFLRYRFLVKSDNDNGFYGMDNLTR